MRVFTSHQRSADLLLVKEGFSWPAFFFSALWALWHRMWLTAVLLAAAAAAVGALAENLRLHSVAETALSLGVMLFVGFGANDWLRRSLWRRGYAEGPIVVAPDRDSAEWRLLAAGFGAATA